MSRVCFNYITIVTIFLVTSFLFSVDFNIEERETGTEESSFYSMLSADFDNDGVFDILKTNPSEYEPNIFGFNDGTGCFQLEEFLPERDDLWQLTGADYNGDGFFDLALNNMIYLNDGTGHFYFHRPLPLHFFSSWTNSADFNLDGYTDIIATQGYPHHMIYVFLNDGTGSFRTEIIKTDIECATTGLADFNNDFYMDLIGGYGEHGESGGIRICFNDGDATFTEVYDRWGFGVFNIPIGDIDNDGDYDIICGSDNEAHRFLLLFNLGDGDFSCVDPGFDMGFKPYADLTDYDHDGDCDFLIQYRYEWTNVFFENDGYGNFTDYDIQQFLTWSITSADYDHDGDIDLYIVGNNTDNGEPIDYLYRNLQDDDKYINMTLKGRRYQKGSGFSNPDAIGARVLIYQPGFLGEEEHLLGFRQVRAPGGVRQCECIMIHFGIPEYDTVDMRVKWPGSYDSRITQDFYNVPVGNHYTLYEGMPLDHKPLAYDLKIKPGKYCVDIVWRSDRDDISGFNIYRTVSGDDPFSPEGDKTEQLPINSEPITGDGEGNYYYQDTGLSMAREYEYAIKAMYMDEELTAGSISTSTLVPESFEIVSIHPNPAEEEVNITLTTPQPTDVVLEVYDITGRRVFVEEVGSVESGEHTHRINISGLSSGVYSVSAIAGEETDTGRMVVVR